jgi:DNA-binding CsgD family transcriptional regulator
VLFRRGQLEQALALHDRVAVLTAGIENPSWRSWQGNHAAVLVAVGRRAEAVEVVESEIGFAERWGTSLGLGRTLRILGTIRDGDGVDELRESVRVLQRGSAKLELAKAKAALGAKLSAGQADPPREAAEALQSGYLLAAECGAKGLQSRVEHSLHRGGLPVPTPPRRAALTTTERRIMEMSLDGAFDQEIAQALYITTPTVRQTLDAVRRRQGEMSADQFGGVAASR